MKKEIRTIKTINGEKVMQITCLDERWYSRPINNEKGLPEYIFIPSVSWIKSYYYKSPFLIKWIAEKGLTEAEAIRDERAKEGSKIHQATEDIDKGKEIKLNDKYFNNQTNEDEELNVDEIDGIISYRDFIDKEKPVVLASEMTVFDKENRWAGTLDRIWARGEIKKGVRQIEIVDLKTSKSVYKDMIMQISAYSHANIDYKKLGITDEEWKNRKLVILQLGYKGNKNGYKLTEVEDKYDLFMNVAYNTWLEENPNTKPFQKDYSLIIKSTFSSKKEKKENNKTPKK